MLRLFRYTGSLAVALCAALLITSVGWTAQVETIEFPFFPDLGEQGTDIDGWYHLRYPPNGRNFMLTNQGSYLKIERYGHPANEEHGFNQNRNDPVRLVDEVGNPAVDEQGNPKYQSSLAVWVHNDPLRAVFSARRPAIGDRPEVKRTIVIQKVTGQEGTTGQGPLERSNGDFIWEVYSESSDTPLETRILLKGKYEPEV
ncbi:hypothetical protein ACFL59_05050 [Planctomycetota bacterium]